MIAYIQSLSVLEIFNITLALLGSLAALGSINLMKGVVSHADVMRTIVSTHRLGSSWKDSLSAGIRSADTMAVACAFVTLASGLAGQAFGEIAGSWQNGFDTLAFGGILSLLVSNRRSGPFVDGFKHAASLGITALCWILFFARAH